MTKAQISWEEAVENCLDDPEMSELAYNSYFGDPIDAAHRYWKSREFAELRLLLPSKRGKAIDFGAGNGILSWALAKDGWDVTAVEPDPSDLVGSGAIRRLSLETDIKINVIDGTGEKTPFADESFDFAIARQVLHHADNLQKFCEEVARVLRKNAPFISLRDHVISGPHQLESFFDRHPLHNLYGGEYAYSLKEYRSCLTKAGFSIKSEWKSYQSILNYTPDTPRDIKEKIASKLGPLSPFAGLLLDLTPFSILAFAASVFDNRPGRLVSYKAIKI